MLTETESRAVLADGAVVRIRPLRPPDADDVVALHRALSDHDRHLRFFGAPAHLDARVARIAEPPGPAHAAVGAFRRDTLLGVAHYEVLAEPTTAEVAMAVDGRAQAHGVGTLLLEHLVALAREAGVRRFVGTVLATNTRMLRVFQDLGLPYRVVGPPGPEREFVLTLETGEPYWRATSERERAADVASLAAVLRPASVAVVGASRRPGSVGRAVLENLRTGGYRGRLWAVNPHATEIDGVPCAGTVRDLEAGPPDLAVVCLPATAVPAALADCGESGVRAAVVLSAGLSGTPLGTAALAEVRRYGMRLVGPNCIGVVNTAPGVSLNATFCAGPAPAGGVGLATQSGGVAIALLDELGELGVGVSSLVSTGDKFDVSGNDLLMWWQHDDDTRLAVLYLESFGNPRKFSRLARGLARRKPLLALRSGTTEIARRAAASHTAAAATPAVTRDALYEQAGVIAVDTLSELTGTIAALSWQPLPAGNRLAVVSNAGGLGVLAADAAARHGLTLPSLCPDTVERLHAVLPALAATGNPVDTTATVDAATFAGCVDILAGDPGIDAVIAATVPTALGDPADLVPARLGQATKPTLLVRPGRQAAVTRVEHAGTPVAASYTDPDAATAALGHAARYAVWRTAPEGTAPTLPGVDAPRALTIVSAALGAHDGECWLEPSATVELLHCFGLPVIDTWYATAEEGAVERLHELGAPLTLKADVSGLVHKSAAGAVAVGVTDAATVRGTVSGWRERFGTSWRGVVLQPTIPPGRELLVGIHSEPVFGPLVVFGLGGTDTDLISDRTARLAPLTDTDSDRLLNGLRCSPMLWSGGVLDAAAVSDVLLRVSRLAELLPEVAELDLNPLVVGRAGATVLDARVRLTPATGDDPYLRRLRQ